MHELFLLICLYCLDCFEWTLNSKGLVTSWRRGKGESRQLLPGVTAQRETLICGADKTLACSGACQALSAFTCDARSGNANAKSDCASALLARDGEGRDGQSVPNDSQIWGGWEASHRELSNGVSDYGPVNAAWITPQMALKVQPKYRFKM